MTKRNIKTKSGMQSVPKSINDMTWICQEMLHQKKKRQRRRDQTK